MHTISTAAAPVALIWYSIKTVCFICQINKERTYHYSEQAAIKYGETVGATIQLGSLWQTI
jgi:hypothetical protein